MVFNSLEFLIFYPVVLLLYFNLPKKYRWTMLLAASAFFYLYWSVKLIFLILFTTAVSYFAAIIIEDHKDNKPLCRTCLVVTLVACFGVLFFFKYFNFLADSVVSIANLFGAGWDDFSLNLILPVGISFYTFQTLSFVIDVYRGSVPAERHFGYYALYVSFFPQLVAGPIERPENLIPQLHEDHDFSWANAIPGLRKMIIGFFKKVVVADLIATYVNAVYNAPDTARGLSVLIATMLFAVQIYCDFSGYTDIAIGCAEIMGIRLMQNFNRPYTSTSIKEFWKRWHISLSSWFQDYLYFPLGGSRCSRPRHLFNLCVVFLVSGLWHGAAWTFVIWGGLHAFYQVVGHPTQKAQIGPLRQTRHRRECPLGLPDAAGDHLYPGRLCLDVLPGQQLLGSGYADAHSLHRLGVELFLHCRVLCRDGYVGNRPRHHSAIDLHYEPNGRHQSHP